MQASKLPPGIVVVDAAFPVIDRGAGLACAWHHVITDPPYSPKVHAKATSTGSGGRGPVSRDFGFEHLTPDMRRTLAAAIDVTPGWSIVFSDFEGSFAWLEDVKRAEWVRCLPWIRWSQPQITGDRPPSGTEYVLHWHAKGRKAWWGDGGLTHYSRKCMRGADKHPTQKPLDLMLDIVSWFTKPGETVFDPCGGSGTTAVACMLLGRKCVTYEQDPKWAAEIRKRLITLPARDVEKAKDWVVETLQEAEEIERDPEAPGAWNRAQHRIEDAYSVALKVAP